MLLCAVDTGHNDIVNSIKKCRQYSHISWSVDNFDVGGANGE